MDASERLNIVTTGDRGLQFGPKLKYSRLFGTYRNPKCLSKAERAFLLISSLSLLVSMGFTMHRLVTLPKNTDDYTFTIMLCFTTLVSSYYIISGVLKERWPELLVFIVSCIILTSYLAVNVAYASPIPGKTENRVRLSLGVLFLLLNSCLGGWLVGVYITRRQMVCLINCREDMVKRLIWLFCSASLITLDWQLQATMLICALENGAAATPLEVALIVGGALVATIRIGAGYISLAPYENWTTLYHATTACIVVTLLLWLMLLPAMVKLAMNFGKGIKEALKQPPPAQAYPINENEEGRETGPSGEVAEDDHHLHPLNRRRFNV